MKERSVSNAMRSNRNMTRRLLLSAIVVFLSLGGAASAAVPYQDRDCLSCHSAIIRSKKLKRTIKQVDPNLFARTPHKKLHCVDCHSTAILAAKPKTHMTAIQPVDCGQCHYKGNKKGAPNLDITKEYQRSFHGRQRLGKHNKDAPTCKDCHGFHEILPPENPRSMVHRMNVPRTCGRCHGNRALMKKYKIPPDFYTQYRSSAHGRALFRMGLNVTAVCSDCHGAHDIREPKDPVSRMNRKHIPQVCGTCHEGILRVYRRSIHGSQWMKGNPDVPVCTNCHGEHNIRAPEWETSKVTPANVANTCAKCHNSMTLARKYDLPLNRLESFQKTFHGTALQLNSVSVANCASCHGSHDILPSKDPRSSVNPNNLPRTCGRCHPETKKNKNIGKVHITPDPSSSRLLFFVRLAYILLIAGSVAGFCFFIATDLFGFWRRGRAARRRGKKE
jgi:hypothetical protein